MVWRKSYHSERNKEKEGTNKSSDRKKKITRSFNKRKDTLLEKVQDLYTATSAEVSITIRAPSGALYEYNSPNFKQALPSETSTPSTSSSSSQSSSSQSSSSLVFPLTSTRSANEVSSQTMETFLGGETDPSCCRICGEAESENRMWVGCEVKGCAYWRHAWCMGVTAYRKTALKNIKFYCPKHLGLKK
uniref:PHD finger protein ALFIN-LIKE 4-like n=1 Tax=Crassostrea virginica TaxID=6565 RepID=A0A8B8ADK9_CRAVI|nr:PHD finger protein ALFIN-LIKE 4-like [Crassostrea virginica]